MTVQSCSGERSKPIVPVDAKGLNKGRTDSRIGFSEGVGRLESCLLRRHYGDENAGRGNHLLFQHDTLAHEHQEYVCFDNFGHWLIS